MPRTLRVFPQTRYPIEPAADATKPYTVWVANMQLNSKEEALVKAFRRLPATAADELSALAQRLAIVNAGAAVDWSEAWSDADLRDYTEASFRRLLPR